MGACVSLFNAIRAVPQALGDVARQLHPAPSRCRIKSYTTQGLIVRSTQQFSITLPTELAELVRSKVASGEYATDSEVIRDGLRTLAARDRAVESWLRNAVAPAYDALKADPSRALTGDEVRQRLAEKRKMRGTKA